MLLCVGDSLTFGSVGYSYINYLNPKLKAINKGVNGDTTRCAYKRLEKYIRNPKYKKIDTYVIGIGTNDVLLPYLIGVSRLWKIQMTPRVILKKCIKDEECFEVFYEKYLKLLKAHGKKGIMIGLPFIQLKNYPDDHVQKRNDSIKKLCKKYEMVFVDIYKLQKESVEKPSNVYTWRSTNFSKMIAGGLMFVRPSMKDRFSEARGLALTVDGVHFNSLSAKILGEEINKKSAFIFKNQFLT